MYILLIPLKFSLQFRQECILSCFLSLARINIENNQSIIWFWAFIGLRIRLIVNFLGIIKWKILENNYFLASRRFSFYSQNILLTGRFSLVFFCSWWLSYCNSIIIFILMAGFSCRRFSGLCDMPYQVTYSTKVVFSKHL